MNYSAVAIYRKENPEKKIAWDKLNDFYRNNEQYEKPLTCEHCKKESKIIAHHEDYNKPFDVIWLCHKCHKLLHMGKL